MMSTGRAATQAAIRRQLDHICFVFKDPLQYVQKQRAKAGGKSASKGDAPGTEPYDPYLCDFSGGDVIGHLLRFVEGRLGETESSEVDVNCFGLEVVRRIAQQDRAALLQVRRAHTLLPELCDLVSIG